MSPGVRGWVGRHRALAGFLAGVLITGAAIALVGWVILADQRRAAALLAATLSRAFHREVRIERVIDLSPAHIGLAGVHLPAAGGWPADIAADRIEATGPLGAAVRGDAAPVRVTVSGARVTTFGTKLGLGAPDDLSGALRSFLADGPLVDLALAGGALRLGTETSPLSFDLVFRKDRTQAHAEVTVRGGSAKAFVLTADLVASGVEAHLSATGQGSAEVFAGWLPPAGRPALAGRSLDLRADARLDAAGGLQGRTRVGLGEETFVQGEARIRGGVAELSQGAVALDLALGAALAGLPGGLVGRVVLSEVTGRWEPDRDGRPVLTAVLAAPQVTIPAALVGAEVVADGVTGRVALGPAPAGAASGDLGASGALTVARLRTAGMEARPIETRFRATLQPAGGLRLLELDGVSAAVEGARVDGSLAWNAERRRATGRITGKTVELAGLARALAPGWLGAADRLSVTDLDVRLADVNPMTLGSGAVDLTLGRASWRRSNGEIGAGPVGVQLRLADGGGTAKLDAASLGGSLAGMAGAVARLTAEAQLTRSAGGTIAPRRIQATARDRAGDAMLEALLEPTPPGRAGDFRLVVRFPALGRLQALWPDAVRKVTGTATLDAVLSGPSVANVDGRLRVDVPEAVLLGDKVFVRQIAVDLPVRRGLEAAGPPAWGKLEVGELIGYGIVVHDLVTPARVWHDRLALNDLAYALYSGTGKGWAEAEWGSGGLSARGSLTGSDVRVEEFIGAYGIRGGTMTGLLRYELDARYQAGRLGVNGRFDIPEGGRVSIELLDRLLGYAAADPTGVVRSALENLRAFDYKSAAVVVHSVSEDIRVNLSLKGRERFLIFPAKVREINVQDMPLSFLAGQFPGY